MARRPRQMTVASARPPERTRWRQLRVEGRTVLMAHGQWQDITQRLVKIVPRGISVLRELLHSALLALTVHLVLQLV